METAPIKLYVNRQLMTKDRSYIPILYPLLGQIVKPEAPYEAAAYRLHGYDARYMKFVDDIRDADYVVVPHLYPWIAPERPELLVAIVHEARVAGKPLLIDDTPDAESPALPDRSVALRFASYRFAAAKNEIVIPLPAEDLLETYGGGSLEIRQKSMEPSVGFVGWSKISFQTRAKAYAKEIPIRLRAISDVRYHAMEKGIFWRERALRTLSRTFGIRTEIVERSIFGARTDTAENAKLWRQDFVDNLRNCDYALCIKGDVNISFRFYEALSMGRIPLLLDTECVLPLQDEIDYREFCVIVDFRDVEKIGEILKAFHVSCSPERFAQMQVKAREAYEKFLRIDAFTPYLARQLKTLAQ